MKKEYLFQALGDVGDDLIHMAETRKFYNQWKKWVSMAACLALIVSLSALVLPYFPMGCGSSKATEQAAPTAMEERPMEEAKAEAPAEAAPADKEKIEMYESVAEEAATVEEEKMEEDAPAEGIPETETGMADGMPSGAEEVLQITVCSTIYYSRPDVYVDGKPAALGEYIGDVTASDVESLIGAAVYAERYSTWFSNHAVDGQSVPQNIYVEGPDGWFYASTSNEKTVSRYTAADVQKAIDNGETQWILDTFVKPVEAQVVDLLEGGAVADSETLNGLFLASLELNTGTVVDWPWLGADEMLVVHPNDVQQRLSRFLDTFTYDATETEAYDPAAGMLKFTVEEQNQQAYGLYLKRASVEDNRVWLWVGLPETDDLYDEKLYELRFDEDSWRYMTIATPG